MAQSHITLRALAARQVEDIRSAPCGVLFPLTPSLSLGERVNHSLRGEQSRPVGSPLRGARCFLSLRERIKVRGNGVKYILAYRNIPGTVELDESSGGAGGFLNDYERSAAASPEPRPPPVRRRPESIAASPGLGRRKYLRRNAAPARGGCKIFPASIALHTLPERAQILPGRVD